MTPCGIESATFRFVDSTLTTVLPHWQRKTKVLGYKPVPVLLCPPQIPHGRPRIEPGPPQWQAKWLWAGTTAQPKKLHDHLDTYNVFFLSLSLFFFFFLSSSSLGSFIDKVSIAWIRKHESVGMFTGSFHVIVTNNEKDHLRRKNGWQQTGLSRTVYPNHGVFSLSYLQKTLLSENWDTDTAWELEYKIYFLISTNLMH